MNDMTKKILIASSFVFSMVALFVSVTQVKRALLLTTPQPTMIKRDANQKIQQEIESLTPTKLESKWIDVQKRVKDTVVQIFSFVSEFNLLEPYKTPDQGEGAGSGFFINEKGDIVSNYHVVAQSSNIEIQIPTFGLERFDVKIVGVCPERDIALLALTKESREKITKKLGKIPFLTLGDSDHVLRSQKVLSLGYPLGQTRLKSTLGIVSGRERLGSGSFIQITAPLNPGNSGGPALGPDGSVIGINSRAVLEAQNVGYIIPINEVKSALGDLYKVKLLRKPTLGCIFTAATPEMVKYLGNPPAGGWYIAKVFEGTLLESVGVKEGDMLYAINGFMVDLYGEIDVPWSEDKVSLLEFLNRLNVGDTVELAIYRKGKLKNFSFKFEHTYLPPVRMIYPEFEPETIDYEIIGGMVVMQLSLNHVGMLLSRVPDLVRFGKVEQQHEAAVLITNILPNSQAFKARILRRGEIIEEVNGTKVKTLNELRQAILKGKNTGYISLKTDDNFCAVLDITKIIQEEDMLAARYFYSKSPLVEKLAAMPAKGEKNRGTKKG